jgi:hypothetical protein
MEITIVHLTDLHFTQKTDLVKKQEPIVRAILSELNGCDVLYFVISGDIANMGKASEYENASKYLSVIKTLLIGAKPNLKINYIIVPGNHDCNFDYNNQLRSNAVKSINYQTLGEDNSVVNLCLTTQKDFWEFYSNYNPVPTDKLYYIVETSHFDFKINFHCLNTSWMSQVNEEVGGIFFPVKRYSNFNKEENSLNFGVWHHPYNWFTPNTIENNKLEFEKFTEEISSTHFFGHEHKQSTYVSKNLNDSTSINLLSGEILNEDKKPDKSAFQVLKFTVKDDIANLSNYEWKGNMYELINKKQIEFYREYKRKFEYNKDFIKQLNELKIPVLIDTRKDIKLSDIYIYPDLETTFKDSEKLEVYFSSFQLINNSDNVIVIDGESQIGKTSLLSMFFMESYGKNKYPLLINGKNITDLETEKLIKRSFKEQYENNSNFELYRQLSSDNKVLLVDDFQECQFNWETTQKLIESLMNIFGKIIICFDSSNDLLSTFKLEFKKGHYYTIKPFGFKRRNQLIERYYYLKSNSQTYDQQVMLGEIKNTFDNVQNILGERLMPAYPIYILSIIQALQYKPLKQNETSYGYCYQTLIHYSLHNAGVKNEDIDTYLNYLTELAYSFVIDEEENEYWSKIRLNDFYKNYSERFMCPSLEEFNRVLSKAKILSLEEDMISFSYNYVLFFLSAKKISDILHTEDGKRVVTKLFSKLSSERNANILVFITHHSKDITFIEESLLNSMIVLDKSNPITLRKDDPFYDEIKEIAESLKNDLIEGNRNPIKEREKLLEQKDELVAEKEQKNVTNDSNVDELLAPFLHSFRSIEIIGQILKNRKGSLEIKQLNDLISEVYTTGFRTISHYSELLKSMKEEIKLNLDSDITLGDSRNVIEQKILTFLQLTSLKMCLSVFSKLNFCVGTKELRSIYTNVANNLGTPAAKLVTFGINSYYGNVSVNEVKILAEEFKDNIVALRILKSRVRFYVYNRNLDYATKQKLADALKMTITPKAINHGSR